MDERIVQFRVGVMVLATIIITGMLVMLFGKFPGISTGNFTVQMRFDEAPGVAQDTPIRKSGILVGRVTDVSFDDASDGVWITAQLSKPDKVYEHDMPRVGSSLLGDAVIEFIRPEDVPKTPQKIQNGKRYDNGIVTPQPLERLSGIENRLASAAGSIEKASKQWTKVGERVNTLMADNEEQLKRMLDSTEATLTNFDKTMDNMNKLLGDKQMQADIKKAAAELPKTIEDSRRAIASVEASMTAMQKTVDSADRNLKNLEGFTKPPPLTIMADFMGVVGGWVYSVQGFGIDSHHYWQNSQNYVGLFDVFSGVFKSIFFGAAIAVISCHRGFHCDPGAEGVGRAATEAFVYSFVVILIMDLFLGIFLNAVYSSLWPEAGSLI